MAKKKAARNEPVKLTRADKEALQKDREAKAAEGWFCIRKPRLLWTKADTLADAESRFKEFLQQPVKAAAAKKAPLPGENELVADVMTVTLGEGPGAEQEKRTCFVIRIVGGKG